MRVLVLTSTLPRWAGDTEPRFVLDLSRYLKKDCDILILAPHDRGANESEPLEGVNIIRYHYFPERWASLVYDGGITAKIKNNRFRILQVPFLLFFQYLATLNCIREWKPDVIHAHWIIPSGLIAVLASNRKIPVICTSHGGDLYGLKQTFFTQIKQWVIKRCGKITVVSETMKNEILKLQNNLDPSVISMGADLTSKFIPATNLVSRDKFTILFVGRLVEKKGLIYLIDIIPELIKHYPAVKLKIIGSGPMKKTISDRINTLKVEQHVDIYGSLEQSALITHYQNATVFVSPFIEATDGDQEGLGLVLVEAAGCECPVICGDVPAVKDVIEHNVTGQIVNARQPEELLCAIQNVFDNESHYIEMARKMRTHVKTKYDWNNIAAKYYALFKDINNP